MVTMDSESVKDRSDSCESDIKNRFLSIERNEWVGEKHRRRFSRTEYLCCR